MVRARDLLERFRPIGAPGAAVPVGVPADRVADRARELEPVFDLLADVVVECSRIRDVAVSEAARRRHDAALEATRIIDAATREAPVVRAAASARARRRGAGRAEAVLAQGDRDAAALTERTRQRMDDYVERVVTAVRTWPDRALDERGP